MTESAISTSGLAKRSWTPFLLLAVLVLTGLILQPPQWILAGLGLGLFAWLSAASPRNGLWYLFLLGACFLGAPGRPWFWLFEAHVWLWLLLVNLHLLGKGGPGGGRLWLIPLVSLAAVPLGLTELCLKLWVTPWSAIGQQLLAPDVKYPVYPLTEFMKRLAGVLVAATAWRLLDAEQVRSGLKSLAPQLALTVIGLCLAALMLHYVPFLRGDHYLSLALSGPDYGGNLSSPAYNRQYLLMFIMVAAPLIALPWLKKDSSWRVRVLCLVGLLIAAGVAALTGQRSIVLAIMGIAAAVMLLVKGRVMRWTLLGLAGLAGLALLVDLATGSTIITRLSSTGAGDYYLSIWKVAARLFLDHPILGVGTGHYAPWGAQLALQDPSTGLVRTEIFSTPHQQILLYLAEGGVLLLAAYVLSAGLVLWRGVAGCRREFDPCLCAAMVALAVLLAFSLTQPVLYFRNLWFVFWALIGLVGALAPPAREGASPAGELSRPMWAGVVMLLVFLGGAQFIQGSNTPPSSFAGGFYYLERFDGMRGRWVGPKAVVVTKPGEFTWSACVSSFIAKLPEDPQHTRFVVNGRLAREMKMDGQGWQYLELMLPGGEPSVIRIQSARSWNPSQAGASSDSRELSMVIAWPLKEGACPR
jgi:O-antigen ligase